MTTAESTDAQSGTEFKLLPEEETAVPYHFSRGMMLELDACGPYIRRHRQLFPPSEYPDGPVINSVTCRQHAENFDWYWASGNMLNYQGRDEVDRIANSRAERYRPLGPGRGGNTARYAAAFGYVFATQPSMRANVMAGLVEKAARNAERRAREDLHEAEQGVREADLQIKHYQERKAQYEAELPSLREAVEHVKIRAAAALAASKERELENARAVLERLQAEATQAREAADALARATVEPEAAPETP